MNPQVDSEYIPCSLDLDRALGRSNGEKGKSKIRLGIVGAGAMGAEHAETAVSVGQAEIVAICDPNPGSVAYTLKKIPDSSEIKHFNTPELLANSDLVDAIIIATPNYTHFEVVEKVLSSRKPILLEKPLTATLEDAIALADAVADYPAPFYVGLELRYKPYLQEVLHEVLERKSVGSPKMLYIMEHRVPFLEKWKQWNKFSKYSGGTLVEKCCHYFDLFNLLAGARPKRVYASGGQDVAFCDFVYDGNRADIIDNAFVIVDYENGVRANLNLCMFGSQSAREQLIVNGDLGAIYATDFPTDRVEFVGSGHAMNRVIEPKANTAIASTGTHAGSTFYEHLHFYECVRSGKNAPINVIDGLWAVAVGVLAERSILEKRVVEVPASLKRFD